MLLPIDLHATSQIFTAQVGDANDLCNFKHILHKKNIFKLRNATLQMYNLRANNLLGQRKANFRPHILHFHCSTTTAHVKTLVHFNNTHSHSDPSGLREVVAGF